MNKLALKFFTIYVLQKLILIISAFLPIHNNQIIFSSFSGTSYGCNPKYVSKAIEPIDKYRIYWVYQKGKDKKQFPSNVLLVEKHSFKYVYAFLTSKVIFDNDAVPLYMPIRKKQVFINTWHGGGAYKKTGFSTEKIDDAIRKLLNENSAKPDYFISSSKKSSELVIRADLGYKGKILNTGMPRSDILLSNSQSNCIKVKIKKYFNIDLNDRIVLYAPTFRSGEKASKSDVDSALLLDALNHKFGGNWVVFVRAHHRFNRLFGVANSMDVSTYPDMQELLIAADVLITDFSSCMWDFSLMNKPCFILASDITKYDKHKGFHIPISMWPYPIAIDNYELVKNINGFDFEKYSKANKDFLEYMGCYDVGDSTEKIVTVINHICNGENDEKYFEEFIE